jgi:NADPH:quinone reductase-like Zn-dependent oxidoreductase
MVLMSNVYYLRYVNVPLAKLSHKPKTLDHAHAASVTLSWQCAWIIVERLAQVKQGENVLIIGNRMVPRDQKQHINT